MHKLFEQLLLRVSRFQRRCVPEGPPQCFCATFRCCFVRATIAALILTALSSQIAFGGEREALKEIALTGEYSALIRVLRGDGKPAAGARWHISLLYMNPPAKLAEGIIPDSGLVEVTGLLGPEIGLKMPTAPIPDYNFQVNGETAGIIAMYVNPKNGGEILPLPGGAKRKEYTFYVAPMPNDIAPDVELVDLETSRSLQLTDSRGKVVVLVIWSAYCHACPRVLKQIDALVRRKSEWKQRVTIFAASVDADPAEALDAMRQHGSTSRESVLRYCWAPSEDKITSGAKAGSLGRLYHPPGYPAIYLIDQTGRIVSRNFAMNLEQAVAELIK